MRPYSESNKSPLNTPHIIIYYSLQTSPQPSILGQMLILTAASPDGQPGPTARAIKERLGKLRELARRSGAHVPAGSPAKRGRAKKTTASKSDSDAQPSTPQKRKRQSSPKVKEEPKIKDEPEVKESSSDDDDDEVKMEQLSDYPAEFTHAEDTGHMSHETDDFFNEDV